MVMMLLIKKNIDLTVTNEENKTLKVVEGVFFKSRSVWVIYLENLIALYYY